jgi:hypothetical protein
VGLEQTSAELVHAATVPRPPAAAPEADPGRGPPGAETAPRRHRFRPRPPRRDAAAVPASALVPIPPPFPPQGRRPALTPAPRRHRARAPPGSLLDAAATAHRRRDTPPLSAPVAVAALPPPRDHARRHRLSRYVSRIPIHIPPQFVSFADDVRSELSKCLFVHEGISMGRQSPAAARRSAWE